MARERSLDLVEVSPNSDPPVCRIMDYGKYKFDQEKKQRIAKKNQHVTQIKEIRFQVGIDDHDYHVKLKHIKEFLEKKDKVRIFLRLRGRELAHKEFATTLMEKIANDLASVGQVDSEAKFMDKTAIMVISPKK
ncbi:Translation initiation factor 3 [Candidatus Omnitrophus magneticus]|uniref:Translation initiation factor IF-3 n=1 Tax=Candidatus Omnitrophus magneticus TaxID=1609969 RepID=A0A0F0CWV0_9BACT|nr:Translation initiation factor 3 [Candidatus Omnitrophus magneticus]